jgi:Skp family chaperone for outer membrane proteins
MSECLRRSTLPLLLSILVLALVAPWPAQANRMASFGPTVVATIDLQKVMNSLAERGDLEAALTAQSQEILAERDHRQSEIEQLATELEDMVEGSEQTRLQEELDLKLLQEMAWIRFIQQEIDIEKSLMLENLYRSMQENSAKLAEIEGIDLIIINDGGDEFVVSGGLKITRQDQIREQIAMRRVLYRAKAIDISDDLIIRMNNEYAASAGSR